MTVPANHVHMSSIIHLQWINTFYYPPVTLTQQHLVYPGSSHQAIDLYCSFAMNPTNNISNNHTWSWYWYVLQRQQHCWHHVLLSAHATSLHMQLQYLPQQVPQSNITMISSSPWLHHRTLKYSLTNLHLLHCYILGITWPMCISSHPSSDLLYTDHIKYHPPNDSKLQYSPPLPQPYCTQSQMATLTQYSPPGPLQMNSAESPGISTQLNWCNCKLSTASTCTYMMLSSPTTTTWHTEWHCLHWLQPTKIYSDCHSPLCFS